MSTAVDFKKVRESLGLSQEEMAGELAVSREYVCGIEKGRKRPSTRLRERLDHVASQKRGHFLKAETSFSTIPVLSWARAGLVSSYEELPKDWQRTMATDCPDENAFGLTIEGDSMEPKYLANDVITVMPSRAPRNGLIVIKLKTGEVAFKMLTLRVGNHPYHLTSYNHEVYKPRDVRKDEVEWIYPVYEIRRFVWH